MNQICLSSRTTFLWRSERVDFSQQMIIIFNFEHFRALNKVLLFVKANELVSYNYFFYKSHDIFLRAFADRLLSFTTMKKMTMF